MSDVVKEKDIYLYLSVFSVKVYVCKRNNLFPAQTTIFQYLKLHHELAIAETCKQLIPTSASNINYTTFFEKKSRFFFIDTKAVAAGL